MGSEQEAERSSILVNTDLRSPHSPVTTLLRAWTANNRRTIDAFATAWCSMEQESGFVAYAQSHSYDIPLVSQPSMSSSSSSSQLRPTLSLLTSSLDFPDVEPVTRPWKDVYSERSTVERSWRRGRYPVRTLRGHTDGVRVSGSARRSSTLPSISSSFTPATAPYVCGTSRLASTSVVLTGDKQDRAHSIPPGLMILL
jgi:hypothetical protein